MKKFYKGFNEDLTCRGFQYEEGKTYTEGEADLCHKGFHACEDPLDCFGYYAPNSSQFREVVLDGISDLRGNDSKVCAKKITIGVRLSFSQMVKAAFEFRWSKTTLEPGASATGYQGAASTTGYQGAASATGTKGAASTTGYQGAASATGYQGAASATGDYGAASATGTRGAASATGDYGAASATGTRGAASATGTRGAASATGYQGAASATGYQGAASATGTRGAASATGYQGAASATGKDSIAAAFGKSGRAKASLGNWIVLTERGEWDGFSYPIIEVKAYKVDGVTIMPDTYYTLIDGKPEKAEL